MKISFKENYKVDTYQYRITSLKIETVYIHYVTYLWMLQEAYMQDMIQINRGSFLKIQQSYSVS